MMLPTFVIGLREGLEAALIVGIVAAFLRQRGRSDLLRLALLGVLAAVLLCVGVGIALEILSENLPQRQQEGLETIVGFIAVAMVTYMVIWMKRHSRDLKRQLEGAASDAIASGSGMALVVMAFLAVLREGFETVVFLLAAFNESSSGASAGVGAALGIALAVVLGYGIYRGGVRINLSKFFRATGLVLVLVAAGLVATALHTAHEAGWLNSGQRRTFDLTSVMRPGSVQSSLLTGILGIQERPVFVEVIGWAVYLMPLALYVGWPAGRVLSRRSLAAIGGLLAVVAAALLLAAPSVPAARTSLTSADLSVSVSSPSSATVDGAAVTLSPGAAVDHLGVAAQVYAGSFLSAPPNQPSTLPASRIAELNGGRLPIGARIAVGAQVPVSYTERDQATLWRDTSTGSVIDASLQRTVTVTAQLSDGPTQVGSLPVSTSMVTPAVSDAAARRAAAADDAADRRQLLRSLSGLASVGVLAALLALSATTVSERRRAGHALPSRTPAHVG